MFSTAEGNRKNFTHIFFPDASNIFYLPSTRRHTYTSLHSLADDPGILLSIEKKACVKLVPASCCLCYCIHIVVSMEKVVKRERGREKDNGEDRTSTSISNGNGHDACEERQWQRSWKDLHQVIQTCNICRLWTLPSYRYWVWLTGIKTHAKL